MQKRELSKKHQELFLLGRPSIQKNILSWKRLSVRQSLLKIVSVTFEYKYSRMDQVKFVEDSL